MVFNKNMGLISEYEAIMLGKQKTFSSTYITKDAKSEVVSGLLEYVYKEMLGWDAEDMLLFNNNKLIKQLKLERIVKKMEFPPELDREKDLEYLAAVLYPKSVTISQKDRIITVYKRVLSKELDRYPKNFFNNASGHYYIQICLYYALNNFLHFKSVRDLYKQFSDIITIKKFLRKYKLHVILSDMGYVYPIDMLHDNLAEGDRNELYYNTYRLDNMLQL